MASKKITFTLPANKVGQATAGLLLGSFNNWNYVNGIKLNLQPDGSMTATVALETGQSYEYRYYLNDGRWVNDDYASDYLLVPQFNAENCVIHVPKGKEAAVLPAKEQAAAPAEKGKRGRKPGSTKKAAAKVEKTESTPAPVAETTPAKRGRRPRLTTPTDMPIKSETKAATPTEAPSTEVKRRGRPAGALNKKTLAAKAETAPIGAPEVSADADNQPVVKRRGRPAGAKNKLVKKKK